MKKSISIIPKYEDCPHNCWFCIWKGHKLENIYGPSLKNIKRFLFKYNNLGYKRFSVSGSDIIFEKLNKYKNWWNEINKICDGLNMQFDIHTKSRIYNKEFLKNKYLRKLVLSTEKVEDIKEYIDWLKENIPVLKIRLVKVVTSDSFYLDIRKYCDLIIHYNIQMTFKQLTGYNDNGNYYLFKSKLENYHPNILFLDKGDYNIYLMPDGNEYEKFLI